MQFLYPLQDIVPFRYTFPCQGEGEGKGGLVLRGVSGRGRGRGGGWGMRQRQTNQSLSPKSPPATNRQKFAATNQEQDGKGRAGRAGRRRTRPTKENVMRKLS